MKKNITIIKYSFKKKGGLEKQAFFIIKELLQKGYKINCLTTQKSDFYHENLTYHIFKTFKFLSFLKILSFDFFCKKWIKKNTPKIIFSFERTSNQTILRAGNGIHKEYLKTKTKNFFKKISFYINPLHLIILNIEKKAFKNPFLKKIITNSEMVKKEIIKNYNINPKKIDVLHNGVEWEQYKSHFNSWIKEKPFIIKKLKIPESKHYFLFIGNGYKRKGLDLLLRACSLIKNLDFHLLIVGKDKKIKKFQKLTSSLKIDKKATFFSKRDDIINFYKISDTLVLPSFYDPFANVSIEALAMGVFVITSKKNGAFEIINKENGIVLNDITKEEIKKSLIYAIKNHKKEKYSKMIRMQVKDFDFSNKMNKLIKIIENA